MLLNLEPFGGGGVADGEAAHRPVPLVVAESCVFAGVIMTGKSLRGSSRVDRLYPSSGCVVPKSVALGKTRFEHVGHIILIDLQ